MGVHMYSICIENRKAHDQLTTNKTKNSVYREVGKMSAAHTYVVLTDSDDEPDDTNYDDEYTGNDGVQYVKRGKKRKTFLFCSYYTDKYLFKIVHNTAGSFDVGGREFDLVCSYGNEMLMNKETVKKLNKEVNSFKPDIPYYVYKLTNETVTDEG
jgi:hypothetical protein